MCVGSAQAALGDVIYPGTPFKLYAIEAGEWVRVGSSYPSRPMRSADGISQAEATSFKFVGGNSSIGVPTPSEIINLEIYGSTTEPYCEPRSGVGAWTDDTLMCWATSTGAWLRVLDATGTYPGSTIVNSGDQIYLLNERNRRFCTGASWPINAAAIFCSGPDPYTGPEKKFRIVS
jgi:hypothetical protein